MSYKKFLTIALLVAVLALAAFPAPVSAEMHLTLDLPPGIAKQSQPLLEQMMHHMQQMEMTEMQMQMMMADMQAMADQLPPGIFLQLLKIMLNLDMPEMMQLHQAIQGGLLQQPPGQVLVFARSLS